MGIASCTEITNREASLDRDANKRYRRTFQVLTEYPTDGARQVLACVALPGMGSSWQEVTAGIVTDEDDEAVVVERRADQSDAENFQNWTVTVEYAGVSDPTALPAEVEWSSQRYQVALQKDLGDPPQLIANSAGDPFEGGVTADRSRFSMTIRKNVTDFDPSEAAGLIDTVNSTPFLIGTIPPGFGVGAAKIADIRARRIRRTDNATFYWERSVVVELNPDGWNPTRILDAGYNELLEVEVTPGIAVPERVPIILGNGAKPANPQPLDGNGVRLSTAADPVYREFVLYAYADWSNLNLDY